MRSESKRGSSVKEIALQFARQAVSQFVSSRFVFAWLVLAVVVWLGLAKVIPGDGCVYLIGGDLAAFGGVKAIEWFGKAKAEGNGGGAQ